MHASHNCWPCAEVQFGSREGATRIEACHEPEWWIVDAWITSIRADLTIPTVVPLRTMFVSLTHYLSIRNHQFSHPRFLQADLSGGSRGARMKCLPSPYTTDTSVYPQVMVFR